jgi:MmyB-like transcription regulator ligand binding domain
VLAGVSVPYYTRLERGELAPLGRALYLEMFDGQERPNAARFVFFDPRARDFYLDWDRIARDVVATLRSAAGRNPYDRQLSDLVGELSTRSEEFRRYWAHHDVRFHISGVKRFHHSQVGDLELNYERLDVVFDTGLTIFAAGASGLIRSPPIAIERSPLCVEQ